MAAPDQPLVTACVGTFNRERYLRETLDGVFAQTYPRMEVIVVDDASTDGSARLIEAEYGSRLQFVRLPENSGRPAVPRNVAARRAKGDYVAFLDSDDGWYPERLTRQVAFLEAHPDIPFCHAYCHLLDEDSKILGVRHEGALPPTGDCFRELARHCFISISSVLVRRSLLDEVGLFNEDPRYRAREDYEWFMRIARRHPVGLVDEVLARYRRAPTGISQVEGAWRTRPQDAEAHRLLLMRRDIWEGRVPRKLMRDALLDALEENTIWWRDRGRAGRALWFALWAWRVAPWRPAAWREGLKTLGRLIVPRSRQ